MYLAWNCGRSPQSPLRFACNFPALFRRLTKKNPNSTRNFESPAGKLLCLRRDLKATALREFGEAKASAARRACEKLPSGNLLVGKSTHSPKNILSGDLNPSRKTKRPGRKGKVSCRELPALTAKPFAFRLQFLSAFPATHQKEIQDPTKNCSSLTKQPLGTILLLFQPIERGSLRKGILPGGYPVWGSSLDRIFIVAGGQNEIPEALSLSHPA